MRGDDRETGSLFSYVDLEARVPQGHPLRPMRQVVEAALSEMSPAFEPLYAATGRPSIPPERLLRALLLQVLFTVRSERQLMEQLEYNLIFRWFVGLGIDDPVWDPTVFTKNPGSAVGGQDAPRCSLTPCWRRRRSGGFFPRSTSRWTGTLIEAWASHKSFQPKAGGRPNSRKKRRDRNRSDQPRGPKNPTVDFRGERRVNQTHASTTDPEARLARIKGKSSKLAYAGHVLIENRNGSGRRHPAYPGHGDGGGRCGALDAGSHPGRLPCHRRRRSRLRPEALRRGLSCVPRDPARRPEHDEPAESESTSAPPATPGYAISQRRRKIVEEVFGWMKTVGLPAQDPPQRESESRLDVHLHRRRLQPGPYPGTSRSRPSLDYGDVLLRSASRRDPPLKAHRHLRFRAFFPPNPLHPPRNDLSGSFFRTLLAPAWPGATATIRREASGCPWPFSPCLSWPRAEAASRSS